jgi:Holliday junction resolvase-like predicted endonuclease
LKSQRRVSSRQNDRRAAQLTFRPAADVSLRIQVLITIAHRIIIRNGSNCLVFVEVKTRSSEDWVRPAAAVDARKRRLLSQCGLDYLKLLKHPEVKIRFDIVEVLLANGNVREIRHLPNTFHLAPPYRYG